MHLDLQYYLQPEEIAQLLLLDSQTGSAIHLFDLTADWYLGDGQRQAIHPKLSGDTNHNKTQLLWYPVAMLRGVFQRAAVAIVLMGSMLTPFGNCLQRTHKTAHSCCSHASESHKTAQTNCCVASAPLSAVVVAPNLPGSAPMTAAQEFISLVEFSSRSEFPSLALIPPHSPPTGAFNLRI
jgi:hypothetical protein